MEQYEHLDLTIVPEDYLRKKHGGGGYKIRDKNRAEFVKAEIKQLTGIQHQYKQDITNYKKYFDPSLIFKISLNQNVSDENFREDLRRAGIETIAAAPDKNGYWVVFAEGGDAEGFIAKLRKNPSKDKADFIDAISGIREIPSKEKIGEGLGNEPFKTNENTYLDIEIWRMKIAKLESYLTGLKALIENRGGWISDKIVTENFCLLRVHANKKLYDEILAMREVAHVDRPPKISLETYLRKDLRDLNAEGKPADDAAGIMIVDSGLRNHPLLKNAIRDGIAIPTKNGKIVQDDTNDDTGHGTTVAGIALYGDIEACIKNERFSPKILLYPARVMYADAYGNTVTSEEELVENQLRRCVKWIVKNHPNCKIVNLSLGNSANKMHKTRHQFTLATLIDELAEEYGIIFVISAGNNLDDSNDPDKYPNYLLEDDARVKIIDPASSALALTIGAVYKKNTEVGSEIVYAPSPLTRVGPGLRGMIKPELVEDGGGGQRTGVGVILLNPAFASDGRLFTVSSGTSYSTPKVSHMLARLMNKPTLRNASPNLVKALLLASATIPSERPGRLSKIKIDSRIADAQHLLNVYGYGKPDLEDALYSTKNRVVLHHSGKVGLNKVQLFSVYLPEEFINESGARSISVTLVFNPPIRRTRAHYIGAALEAHLFRSKSIEEIAHAYTQSKIEEEQEEVIPEKLKNYEIKLYPGVNLRKRGVHQKGIKEYSKKPKIDVDKPLVLAVVCQDKGFIENKEYEQSYAVVVTITHSQEIDLYNKIQLKNQSRIRIQ